MRNVGPDCDDILLRVTRNPLRQRIMHITGSSGGADGNCALELVPVTPPDVLQLQATASGWTDGGAPIDPLINFEVT